MAAIERFAEAAIAFRAWVDQASDTDEHAARNALLLLSRLYVAALELPTPPYESVAHEPSPDWLGDAEWLQAFEALRRLPIDYYNTVSDPLAVPDVELSVGSLSDDVADIYRDVVSGLSAYDQGLRLVAAYEWGFSFRVHWGGHATHAIGALHSWLEQNARDLLSPGT